MQSVPPHGQQEAADEIGRSQFVTDDALVLRNYDGSETYTLTVAFRDAEDELAFERTYTLGPNETVRTQTRLRRAVYEVTVRLGGTSATSIECLIGSGPAETAVVEVGNGVCSVVEGAERPSR